MYKRQLHFVYKLNIFGGSSKKGDSSPRREGDRRGGPGGGPGGMPMMRMGGPGGRF